MLCATGGCAPPTHRVAQAGRGRRLRLCPGAAAVCAAAAESRPTTVKVCGVTTPAEALHAAQSGANLIGLILWPRSKRSVTDPAVARAIADAARQGGAEPVGVFVDEDAATVLAACDAAGITIAQLHGDGARRALLGLPERIRAIYVLTASPEGVITTPLPGDLNPEAGVNALAGEQGWRKAVDWLSRGRRTVDWLLVDGQAAGSGQAFDWRAVRVPRGASRRGWLLAGGLTPTNVGLALAQARPDGVDVASGVAASNGVTKDPALVEAFIAAARGSTTGAAAAA